ncbi:similar to short-chain dehydrogenase [Botrytis cinerea T4]|uniref:Similar to short-chain dehydrogenase n=1 Tax=Botryotinia fuckeliana (strain T4) TaxID=999810 RepID=G2YQL1_BOTF4|nr:similar to short-chain dehydrogenase [Botrytis cinerea T4]
MAFASMKTQYFPPAPTFTEKDVGAQTGKVFIITGGNQGVGFELIKMLYPTGATVYMASRSEERAAEATKIITSSDPSNASRLKFLHLDLSDLNSVWSAAQKFAKQEMRLDILLNNAGVGGEPVGSKTKQGIELHIGVNVIAPLLLTQLLHLQLRTAATSSPKASVRVIWTSSWMIWRDKRCIHQLCRFESSECDHFNETSKRYGKDSVISVVQNPGNLQTNIYHTQSRLMMLFVNRILYPPKMGAYTTLFAGLSKEITEANQGSYIIPWGRVQEINPRKDIYEVIEKGKGKELWEWCEKQIKANQ